MKRRHSFLCLVMGTRPHHRMSMQLASHGLVNTSMDNSCTLSTLSTPFPPRMNVRYDFQAF